LPCGIGVAVFGVHAKLGRPDFYSRETIDDKRHGRNRSGHVGVVIVPDQHVDFIAIDGGDGVDVGGGDGAVRDDLIERQGCAAFGGEPLGLFDGLRSPSRPVPRPSIPIMRKTLRTGLSMPPVASSRNPAKAGWSSNSKAQVTAPSTVTPYFRASS